MKLIKIKPVLLYLTIGLGLLNAQPGIVAYKTRESSFYEIVEALGTLRAQESVELSSPVTDVVSLVKFEDGQRVEKGDLLVAMTSAEEAAQLEEVRSRASEAKLQYRRVQELARENAASQSLSDQRRREFETFNAQLKAIQARLEDRLIVAPFAGVLGLRNVSPGTLLRQGDVIVTLDDDSVMKLDFQVPSTLLGRLQKISELEAVTPAYPDKKFKAKVQMIGSRIDPVSRAVTVRALLDNSERMLKPGMLMTVRIKTSENVAVGIPEESVIERGRVSEVLALVPGAEQGMYKVEKRPVDIALRVPPLVALRKGVAAGELVVYRGVQYARAGAEVKVAEIKNYEDLGK